MKLQDLLKNSDVLMAFAVLGIIGMLLVPLPADVLDFLLVVNIIWSVIVILISMYVKDPLEFGVFPTLLLVSTLFRLALDVSATRLILLNAGEERNIKQLPDGTWVSYGAGHVIPSVANFVIGGNLVVGIVMFLILITIQFIVITQGAERIAQVGARFTLDAMPGKQMAIDADLHAGLLDPDTARKKREAIQKEADFYGSMDGAGKFVKGDAIAAIIIVVINIIGGLVMGVLFHHMDIAKAAQIYTLLTIGNGLITTMPAFLMSTAMGIIVSRAASNSDLGHDVFQQIVAQPKVLKLAGAASLGFAVLSIMGLGLPAPPFLLLGGGLLAGGILLENKKVEEVQEEIKKEEQKAVEQPKKSRPKKPENVMSYIKVEPLSVEVGRSLLPLVDPSQGAKLLERVGSIRRHIAKEIGVVVPGIQFRDNLQIKPNAYVINIKDVKVAEGEVVMNSFLAIGPETQLSKLKGTRTVDPTYGMPAVWIRPDQRGEAEKYGCMIFDPVSVIATQLTEVIRNNAYELLGRQEVQALIDTVKKTHPAVVKEVYPDVLSLGEIQKVLQNLVKERVPIKDLVTILETLGDYVHITKDPDSLTEYVRQALSRVICKEYVNNDNVITALTLDPQIENIIAQGIQRTEYGSFLTLDPNMGQQILEVIGNSIKTVAEKGLQPIILCNPQVRPFVRKLTDRTFPDLVILSYNEIAPRVNVKSIGVISFANMPSGAGQMQNNDIQATQVQ